MIYDDIKKTMDDNMIRFFNYLNTFNCNLTKDQLFEKWQDFNNIKKINPTVPPKKSGYQNFFAQKRIELKAKNPSIPFTDLSKIISQEWNKLTSEQKNNYIQQTPQIPPNNYTFDELNQKKMSELKDLCEKIGLKKSGNKTDLIRNLLGQNDETVTTEVSSIIEPPDQSLEIYVSSKSGKRSDFEINDDLDIDDDKFNDLDSETTIQDDESSIDDQDSDEYPDDL